jgi:hypothetical protein
VRHQPINVAEGGPLARQRLRGLEAVKGMAGASAGPVLETSHVTGGCARRTRPIEGLAVAEGEGS